MSNSLYLRIAWPSCPSAEIEDLYHQTELYVMTGTKSRVFWMLSKYLTNWIISQLPFQACMYVCSMYMSGAFWGQRGSWLWNWSYRFLVTNLWRLGPERGSSTRTSALKHWTISPTPLPFLLWQSLTIYLRLAWNILCIPGMASNSLQSSGLTCLSTTMMSMSHYAWIILYIILKVVYAGLCGIHM